MALNLGNRLALNLQYFYVVGNVCYLGLFRNTLNECCLLPNLITLKQYLNWMKCTFSVLPPCPIHGMMCCSKTSSDGLAPVWPDWAIYWTLGNFVKLSATINLSKSSTLLGNFCKALKSFIFLVKFYRHLAFFLVTLPSTLKGTFSTTTNGICWKSNSVKLGLHL